MGYLISNQNKLRIKRENEIRFGNEIDVGKKKPKEKQIKRDGSMHKFKFGIYWIMGQVGTLHDWAFFYGSNIGYWAFLSKKV